jgi:glycosyltransferase involved in cell wall biosynthesis
VVGIVARLGEEKNHEMFLRVARRVLERVPSAHFLIVGDGPRRGALVALAGAMRIGDCVHFTGARGDVPQLLSLLDVFLLTSHNEASPVSLLEAMASGTPVVATDIGSVAEMVIDGQVGYLVAPDDDVSMSQRVIALLEDDDSRATVGQIARDHVVSHGSVETMVLGYERLMRRLWSTKRSQFVGRAVRRSMTKQDIIKHQ